MTKELKIGDAIPKFFLKDHKGFEVSKDAIIGSTVVIYFYPKDDTPGCTEEACSFRDDSKKFHALETLVIGVSPDNGDSHKKFMDKNNLKFTLLSDDNKEMCRAFSVLDDKDHIIRSTFVVNARGIIVWIEKPVSVKGHTERVLKGIEEHCKQDRVALKNLENDYENFLHANLTITQDQKKIEAEIMKRHGIKKSSPDEKKKK